VVIFSSDLCQGIAALSRYMVADGFADFAIRIVTGFGEARRSRVAPVPAR